VNVAQCGGDVLLALAFQVGECEEVSHLALQDHIGNFMGNCFKGLLAAVAATLTITGPAHANLQGRDINGLAVASTSAESVFLYDTDLNITWLRDANVNGPMNWNDAKSWAANYTIGKYDNWRLPTALDMDGSGPSCVGSLCTGSEMGHLWFVELGNSPGLFRNPVEFLNMQATNYWSSTEFTSPTDYAWYFYTVEGVQGAGKKYYEFNAMAVMDGDVLAVPEPGQAALFAIGLAVIGYSRRKQ
jgi:hypothetical protein